MRKPLLIVIVFCWILPISAQDYNQTVVTDPSISIRCQSLIKKRQDKITIRQKLEGLISRNRRLQKNAPKNKVTVKDKLQLNMKRLQRELTLTNLKIKSMTENVVRKGCPGIRL